MGSRKGAEKKRRKARRAGLRPAVWLMIFILLPAVGLGVRKLAGREGDSNFMRHRDEQAVQGKEMVGIDESLWDDGGQSVPPDSSANDMEMDRLYSPYAILMDVQTEEVLAERCSGERMYPASLTKIMTALLAVEFFDNLEEQVTVPEEIFAQLYEEEASMAGFLPGEKASIRDLLYGVLLPSGAECCLTLADVISGSEASFVSLMNEKAAALGMDGTHFCNCTGLHDRDHYTTAKDLANLLLYALQKEEFREIFTASYYYVTPNDWHPDGFVLNSTMYESMDDETLACGILGGKTGYTEEAGLCLASLAQVGGREYILVTAGAEGSHETKPFHIMDATYVYEQIARGEKAW